MDGCGKEIAGRSGKMTNEMESHKEKSSILYFWTAVPAAGDALRNANFMRWCRVRDITGSIYAFAMAAESVMRSVRSGAVAIHMDFDPQI